MEQQHLLHKQCSARSNEQKGERAKFANSKERRKTVLAFGMLSNSRRLTKLHRDRKKRNIISGGHRCAWNINSDRIHIVLIPPPSIMHVSPLPRRYHTWIGDRFRLGGLHPRQAYPLTLSSSRKSNLDQEWPRRNETCTRQSKEVIKRHRVDPSRLSRLPCPFPHLRR